VSAVERLEQDYRAAFTGYLSRREEPPLAKAYEIGRAALEGGVGILELVRIHHDVFGDFLAQTVPVDLPPLSTAASEFLLEAVAPFDLARQPPPP
jgi:hypothetical protein